MAQGSGRARDSKATTDDTRWRLKSELPSDDDDNLQKQIRAAVKQALQAKQQGQEINSAEAKDGGAN